MFGEKLSILVLPVCDKIFECLHYNSLFDFLIQKDLISPVQPGFNPGDSSVNQLLSVTHEITLHG